MHPLKVPDLRAPQPRSLSWGLDHTNSENIPPQAPISATSRIPFRLSFILSTHTTSIASTDPLSVFGSTRVLMGSYSSSWLTTRLMNSWLLRLCDSADGFLAHSGKDKMWIGSRTTESIFDASRRGVIPRGTSWTMGILRKRARTLPVNGESSPSRLCEPADSL